MEKKKKFWSEKKKKVFSDFELDLSPRDTSCPCTLVILFNIHSENINNFERRRKKKKKKDNSVPNSLADSGLDFTFPDTKICMTSGKGDSCHV